MNSFARRLGVPIVEEFERYSYLQKWYRLSRKEYRKLEGIFVGTAVVDDFTRHYGKDPNNLAAWKRLCRDVGFRRNPNTIAECHKASSNLTGSLNWTQSLDWHLLFCYLIWTDVIREESIHQHRSVCRSPMHQEKAEGRIIPECIRLGFLQLHELEDISPFDSSREWTALGVFDASS